MESSRIFVRGLPPTLTEDEFKKHFAIQPVTDFRLMSQRRIGYVGYRTPEDASKAVKYFNKSFIRMSRIAVELARPVADAPIPRKKVITRAHFEPGGSHEFGLPETNLRKRKRPDGQEHLADPKLAEYLETMKPASKRNGWETSRTDSTELSGQHFEDTEKVDAEASSDEEYQDVPKKLTSDGHSFKQADNQTLLKKGLPLVSRRQDEDESTTNAVTDNAERNSSDMPADGVAVSDADWLRSRTLRTLDIDEDNGEKEESKLRTGHLSGDLEEEHESLELEGSGIETKDSKSKCESDLTTVDQPNDDGLDSVRSSGRLFLRNLPYSLSQADLQSLCSSHGNIDEVHVPLDFKTGANKGFAHVQFTNPEDAVAAFQALDGIIFQGRLLHVLPAAAKRENKLDEYTLSKLPLKKQRQIQRKAEAATTTFNWNNLYMNADAVISSISDRLGVSKSEVLDPTSSDAAVKQAQAETHIIQETKAYFAENGVDLEAFKSRERGDTAILIKNFPYGTTIEELRELLEEHGSVTRLLMPPSGTIAIAGFAQVPQAKAAFSALAYRKFKGSILFLEKAPKEAFNGTGKPQIVQGVTTVNKPDAAEPTLSTTDLLQREPTPEAVDTTTLFVRNLSFQTTTERLTQTFKPLDGFLSARVKTKTDPKKPGQILSMGFGFLEFNTKSQAQAALSAMQGYNLDGHRLLIKASHKALDAAEERRKDDQAKKVANRRTKIIIKNLPFEASKKDLRTLFGAYGQLRSIRLPKKHDSSTRGFAFADFTTPREAESAINALRDTHLLGRRLVLDFAAEDPDDAEEEIEKMQKKVGLQVNKVALEKLTGGGRKKFRVGGNDDLDGV